MKYIIALDAGTTSVRAFLYDLSQKKFIYRTHKELTCAYPQPGWVEQSGEEIFEKATSVLHDCIRTAGEENVAGIGVTNQRETVLLFDEETGKPIAPTIVWQCRRTSEFCASIPKADAARIREKTGLLPDAYFSASKIKWLLEHVPVAKSLFKEGRLRAATVESYLIKRLTGHFVTDYTNASRTMLFNLKTLDWDEDLLSYFGVPREILPTPLPCDAIMGHVKIGARKIPVAGVLGDQQAALFGQACFQKGDGKITYGTGLFMLFPTGNVPTMSESGLLTTVAASHGGKTTYALEGSVFHAGSGVQWLRDEMGLISHAAESEELANSVKDTGGVFFVPAFTGLGAPHWNSTARAMLAGISRGTRKEHIVRAVLESIAYSARELAECMVKDSGIPLASIKCDGGASANGFLMQFQADVLGIKVDRPVELESTALGAAFMCALALGLADEGEIATSRQSEKIFLPSENRSYYDALFLEYRRAVKRAL